MSTNTCYYGYISGLITAFTLQPLDNIKMTLMLPPTHSSHSSHHNHHSHNHKLQLTTNFINNICNVSKYMYATQGFSSFYKGLVVNVWKTGLGSAIYFYILRAIQNVNTERNAMGSFLASGAARIVSSALTNPLAVAETRYQISGVNRWEGNLIANLLRFYKDQGIYSFFKGCNASCLKQAGFAGIYYVLYQKGKQMGFNSFASGMAAGLISTISTHPLQIIRTKAQALTNNNNSKNTLGKQLALLVKQKKVFDGVAPRLIKKPAANTIGFLLFQYLQKLDAMRTQQ